MFEGEVVTIMSNDARTVQATFNSEFYDFLVDRGVCDPTATDTSCMAPQSEYIEWFFGGEFTTSHIGRNFGILFVFLLVGRFGTWLALKYIRFS